MRGRWREVRVECVRACVRWLVYAIWEKGGMLCMSLHQVQVRADVQHHHDDGDDLNAASAAATVSGARGGSEILFRRDKKRVSLTRLAKKCWLDEIRNKCTRCLARCPPFLLRPLPLTTPLKICAGMRKRKRKRGEGGVKVGMN